MGGWGGGGGTIIYILLQTEKHNTFTGSHGEN